MKQVKKEFKSVFSYAYGVEDWVNRNLPLGPLKFTFASDFAIADWYSRDDVEDTYKRVKKAWIGDYKAFTEVVIALNMLSWANVALRDQGFAGRDDLITLYADLYYRAMDDFYAKYEGNTVACDYFLKMTD